MNERPMRQISLRAFRGQIADLHQPVEVSKRDGSGNIQVLGYWTPYVQIPDDAKSLKPWQPGDEAPTATISVLSADGETVVPPVTLEIPLPDDDEDQELWSERSSAPKVINTPEEAAVAVPVNPVRAVPKPSQRRKK